MPPPPVPCSFLTLVVVILDPDRREETTSLARVELRVSCASSVTTLEWTIFLSVTLPATLFNTSAKCKEGERGYWIGRERERIGRGRERKVNYPVWWYSVVPQPIPLPLEQHPVTPRPPSLDLAHHQNWLTYWTHRTDSWWNGADKIYGEIIQSR